MGVIPDGGLGRPHPLSPGKRCPPEGVIFYLFFCQTAVLAKKITTAKKTTKVKKALDSGSDSDTTVTPR